VKLLNSLPKKMKSATGRLVVKYGPMWSDKTSWLIEVYKQNQKALVFKPGIDDRYTKAAVLSSHNGEEVPAVLVDNKNPKEILELMEGKELERILIDETNFFDDQLLKIVKVVRERGIDVYAAGLMMDSEKNDFGVTRKLSQEADEVVQGFAKCDYFFGLDRCLNKATLTYAKYKKDTQLVVGAADIYGACCERHYNELYGNGELHWSWLGRIKKTSWEKYIKSDWKWLGKIQLPYSRRRLPKGKRRWPRVEVGADSMRVGKTTAVKVLVEGFKKKGWPVEISLEDWQHNPYLKQSYADPSQGLLKSQKWFIKRKFEQLNKVTDGKMCIQDVHPEMDFAYALTNVLRQRMDKDHFVEYLEYFNQFNWQETPAPDLLVYLTISDGELIRRTKEAMRDFEMVNSDYFVMMKAVNRTWVMAADKMTVLMVDTDNFDYSKDKNAQEELVDRVFKSLKHLGWRG